MDRSDGMDDGADTIIVSEKKQFDTLRKYRDRCLMPDTDNKDNRDIDRIRKGAKTVDFSQRISEILEHEEVVCEMWKRLDMDLDRGDLSFPLRTLERETPVSTYTFLHTFFDIIYGPFYDSSTTAVETKD